MWHVHRFLGLACGHLWETIILPTTWRVFLNYFIKRILNFLRTELPYKQGKIGFCSLPRIDLHFPFQNVSDSSMAQCLSYQKKKEEKQRNLITVSICICCCHILFILNTHLYPDVVCLSISISKHTLFYYKLLLFPFCNIVRTWYWLFPFKCVYR